MHTCAILHSYVHIYLQPNLDGPVTEAEGLYTIKQDIPTAYQYYMQASANGHPLALHRLAHMQARGLGTLRSCTSAVLNFKNVAEQGGSIAVKLNHAYMLCNSGHIGQALMIFAQMASIG